MIDFLVAVPMTFTVEDDALRKSKELILGTYANLSCLYKSHEWNRGPFSRPFIKFFRADRDGVDTGIIDSHEAPPNYESQGNIVIAGIGTPFASGTRKLFLRRIDASTAATYLCRVITTHGCVLEKKLELRTSMFYFQLNLHLQYKESCVNDRHISTILDQAENSVRVSRRRNL